MRWWAGGLVGVIALLVARPDAAVAPQAPLWQQVEIIRTTHGVPHIRAENLRAGGYALGWLQCEDYGDATPVRLWATRGQTARVNGRGSLDADFTALRERERAIETYHLLEPETRDFYEGFAAGVNRYVELHRAEFEPHIPADFTGYDVATLHIGDGPPAARIRRLVSAQSDPPDSSDPSDPEEGSNAWAFAPSRTQSGRAILLRNPHLAWNAGYYEAHLTVPGLMDFYGDFRIGGPLGVIGGFNRYLGWSTTNSNAGDRTEIYALEVDPDNRMRYRLDGASLPITSVTRTVDYLVDGALQTEHRTFESTPLGPVVHRTDTTVYVARTAGDGEFRAGEQFLKLMRARSLTEWMQVMRMRALVSQNYTYADRAGNILTLWNASLPLLPHPMGGDRAIPARTLRDVWTQLVPFDALPLTRNPGGGYVHNENDSPHFANARPPVNLTNAYENIEPPSLRLRSQRAIQLIDNNRKLSLQDVIRLKHDYRMLLADRVKPDLLRAISTTAPTGPVSEGLQVLRRWNNSVAPDSRGAVLFEVWWSRYSQGLPEAQRYAVSWQDADPVRTPRGLADPARAIEAFAWAVDETVRRHGALDVAWGDVYRVRRGDVDVPVGGCPGALGCFRVLGYQRQDDGKMAASTGDGWVLAVEFTDVPRAWSVLAYGQSAKPGSPWHSSQAAMFARGELKRVAFTERDIERSAVVRYRPGLSTASTGR
ncbi:MAG: 7-beta-(4-carbaxybutanamido)cephalosporanic acid acylase [Acidimicrobiia bacterium]|jgi:acyl-homoserine-lactone acylase